MERICGDATVGAVGASKAAGVQRFVFISAKQYVLPPFILKGYYAGKTKAEKAVRYHYPDSGYSIRPSFIFSDQRLPYIGYPLQKVCSPAFIHSLAQLPLFELALTTPVHVDQVGTTAAKAALGEIHESVVDVDLILKYGSKE